jgi:DNA-binding protein H-NS
MIFTILDRKTGHLFVGKKFDLDGMSIDELWLLHEKIGRILSVRLTVEKRALEKRLAHLRREEGRPLSVSDNGLSQKKIPRLRRKYPRVYPKYRNSEDPFETWSGRGRQPLWLTAALRKGRKIEDFLIRNPESGKGTVARKRS